MLALVSAALVIGQNSPQLPAPNVDYFRDEHNAFAALPPQDLGVSNVARLHSATKSYALISCYDEINLSPFLQLESMPQTQFILSHRLRHKVEIPSAENHEPYDRLLELHSMAVISTAGPVREYAILATEPGSVFRRLGVLSSPPVESPDGRLAMIRDGMLWFVSPTAEDESVPLPDNAVRLSNRQSGSIVAMSARSEVKWEYLPTSKSFKDITEEYNLEVKRSIHELLLRLATSSFRVAEKPIFGEQPRTEWWILPRYGMSVDQLRSLMPHERPAGAVIAADADHAIFASPELILILRDQRLIDRRIVPVPVEFYSRYVRNRIQYDALWRAGIAATEMRNFRLLNNRWPTGTEWEQQIVKKIIGYPMSDLVVVPIGQRTNELAYIKTAYGIASIDTEGVATWQEVIP
ncbi:MAG: hypothetical protein KF812_02060 [Fimbriimonadaceae bacterium]|nr:hypothetical protein [Fimbriimonadaceae bacterium]